MPDAINSRGFSLIMYTESENTTISLHRSDNEINKNQCHESVNSVNGSEAPIESLCHSDDSLLDQNPENRCSTRSSSLHDASDGNNITKSDCSSTSYQNLASIPRRRPVIKIIGFWKGLDNNLVYNTDSKRYVAGPGPLSEWHCVLEHRVRDLDNDQKDHKKWHFVTADDRQWLLEQMSSKKRRK